MVAYQGEDISVDRLVFGGAHSLETQSYRPRELLSGHVNADGIGVVWYRDGDPIAFRDSRPVWQVPELEALLRANAAGMALAAVRNVTPGIAIDASGIPPVVRGGVAVVLNGYLEDVQGTFLRPAVETLSDRALGLLRGLSDTELLAVEIDDRRHRGENLADAIVSTAQRVLARGRDTSRTIQLNLAVADGTHVLALRAGNQSASNSLYVCRASYLAPSGHLLASEPLTPGDRWEPVPHNSLIDLRSGDVLTLDL